MKITEKLKAKSQNMYDAEAVTIAFLGDSVTQGCFEIYKSTPTSIETVFEPGSAYATRFREMLAILYPRVQVNIINSGISGDSAPNGAKRLERDVLRYHPDLVVVSYGLNDSGNGVENIDRYTNALADIFSRVKEAGIECIFLTENMMNTHTSCHITDPHIQILAEKFAIKQNDGTLDRYFDAGKKVADEYEIPVCDCYSKWKKMAAAGVNTTELLSNKLNHPIRELNYLFAFSLLETIFE